LLDVKVDKHFFQAFTQYWNPAYSCFTFGKVHLVPTVEEYTTNEPLVPTVEEYTTNEPLTS
ncbi:hypothetical protein Goarm_006542, partial [Gossypium armourianum]|nr:hypothetical protein [Gossypium armourianum]